MALLAWATLLYLPLTTARVETALFVERVLICKRLIYDWDYSLCEFFWSYLAVTFRVVFNDVLIHWVCERIVTNQFEPWLLDVVWLDEFWSRVEHENRSWNVFVILEVNFWVPEKRMSQVSNVICLSKVLSLFEENAISIWITRAVRISFFLSD